MNTKTKIGEIVNVVGIKGELKIYPLTNYYDDFQAGETIYIDGKAHRVEKMRVQKNIIILKISDIDTRNQAEELRMKFVETEVLSAEDLPEGTYLISTLKGMEVKTKDGQKIGEITNVLQNSSQDLYEIKTSENKMILIPAVKEFIKEVNFEKNQIIVEVIEGLLDI